jgi:hypothetical protein
LTETAHSPSGSVARRRSRRTPDEARLIERFKRLAPQHDALKLAFAPFCDESGNFDRVAWVAAFESREPASIRDVKAVTGLYEGLVNHLVEMLYVAARLRGLEAAMGRDRPTGPELFAAVCADKGLTAHQATVLKRLYGMRNELQHASPGVAAEEVYDEIVLLTKTLARFAKSYVTWLQRHDIPLI